MSYNWMGVVNGQANQYTPIVQMWLAEMVANEHHFDYSWMQGQWPNTFPPCSSYF